MIAKLGRGITSCFAKRAVTRVVWVEWLLNRLQQNACTHAYLFEICRNNINNIMHTHTDEK